MKSTEIEKFAISGIFTEEVISRAYDLLHQRERRDEGLLRDVATLMIQGHRNREITNILGLQKRQVYYRVQQVREAFMQVLKDSN